MRRTSLYLTVVVIAATLLAALAIANSVDFEEAALDRGEALAQAFVVAVVVALWLAVCVPSIAVMARDWLRSSRGS